MKKLILGLIVMTSISVQAEKIKIVGAENIPPMMFKGSDGKASGFAFAVAKAAFEKAGYQTELVTCPWSRCQQIAADEGAFIIGFSKTEERLKIFTYTEPMYFDEVILVTPKGKEFPFTKNEDLKGKKMGFQMGATFGDRFEALKKIATVDTDGADDQRVKKLQMGRIDAGAFSSGVAGLNYACKTAAVDCAGFTILPEKIAMDPNFIATGQKTAGAKEKLEKVNKALKELEAAGKIKEIMAQKY